MSGDFMLRILLVAAAAVSCTQLIRGKTPALALLISLVILGLSLVTRWAIIGTLVNLAGIILTHLYVGIAAYYWWFAEKPEQPQPEQQTQQVITQPNQEG